jgi:hypothetical protein
MILCSPSNSILLNSIIEVHGRESWNDNPETTRMMLKLLLNEFLCWHPYQLSSLDQR